MQSSRVLLAFGIIKVTSPPSVSQFITQGKKCLPHTRWRTPEWARAITSFSCPLAWDLGWVSSCQSSARWRAGVVCEGKHPCSGAHSDFLSLIPISKMLVVRVGLRPFTPEQTYYLNRHERCLCGTGFCFCLGIESLVQDASLVSLLVKKHDDLVYGKPCWQCVLGKHTGRPAYQAGGLWKSHLPSALKKGVPMRWWDCKPIW